MSQKSPYQILVKPIITEKAMNVMGETNPQYVFEVSKDANKREIRWAVETAYGVKVLNVTTVVRKGKAKYSRQRGIQVGKAADVKRATVTLAEGQQIELM